MKRFKNKLLHQLLWEGKSKWQLFGAMLGSFLGLLLLLLSLQLYQDVQKIVGGGRDSDDRFLMINKRVNLFNTLGVSAAFTAEEISTLKDQAFIKEVGLFTPNQYKVSASSSLLGFYTELFFESVSEEFLDFDLEGWDWEKGQEEIPIVLSRDYLALYNFGFAPSQGLPQFTPSTIKRVSFDIRLKGNGLTKTFQGRIIGFSDRINSVIVPQNFMEYANATFGGREQAKPSRLILNCTNIYDPSLEKYLKEHNFELSRDRFIGGQLGQILWALLAVIAVIGFIILALSLLVFLLNFQLLIAQSAKDISYLLQQGYPLWDIRKTLHDRLLWMYAGVLLCALCSLWLLRSACLPMIREQGFVIGNPLHWWVWAVAGICGLGMFFLNFVNIRKKVEVLFNA